MAASVLGLHYQIVEECKISKAVNDTREGIEQRIRLECEKEQQGQHYYIKRSINTM